MGFLENSVAFVFVLGVMVLIHELGHFLAARFFDVRVESFAFGFGPRLVGFRRGETDYRICLLPLGGYVKMAGESIGEPTGDPREFLSKPRWQRLIIAAMGPIFNGVLAVGLLAGLYMTHYERYSFWTEPAVIASVREGSPAAEAGLQPGDEILAFDGSATPNWESVKLAEVAAVYNTVPVLVERDLERLTVNLPIEADEQGVGTAGWVEATAVRVDPMAGSPAELAGLRRGDIVKSINGQEIRQVNEILDLIKNSEGAPLEMEVIRDGEIVKASVEPSHEPDAQEGQSEWLIGAYISPERTVTELGFGGALKQSLEDNGKNATLIFGFLRGMFEQRMSAKSLEGPIGIARLSGEAARQGWPELISLMAAISLNLGIFNLLPIPILDGGVILMLLIESVIRRDISVAIKERIIQVGLVFIVLLFAFVMYNDILKSLPSS